MLEKLLTRREGKRSVDHKAHAQLHRLIHLVQPPAGLLDRIESELDQPVVRRDFGRRGMLLCGAVVLGALAVFQLVQPPKIPDRRLFDAMGETVAHIRNTETGAFIQITASATPVTGTYHLWAISRSGEVTHLAALPGGQGALSDVPAAVGFAISLEKKSFDGALPAGPVIAATR